jgi:YD repeat-containing protein
MRLSAKVIQQNSRFTRRFDPERHWLVGVMNNDGTDGKSRFGYVRRADGQIVHVDEWVIQPDNTKVDTSATYTYDALNRLTKEVVDVSTAGADYTKEYTLDLVGNRTKLVETKEGQSPVTTTNTYNARDQLLTATTGAVTVTYSYDSNGSLTMQVGGGDTSTFDWDLRGRMIGAAVTKSGTTTVAEYRYTPNGIRSTVKETVNGGQPTTTLHIIDTLGPSGYAQVVEERTESGVVVGSFVYGPSLDPLSQWRQGQGTNLYLADGHSGVRQAVEGGRGPRHRHRLQRPGTRLGGAAVRVGWAPPTRLSL